MSVRIVDVREVTKPISSPIRNAYIDFTKMTTSLVAVVTDVVRDGKPVVGYGFNSNGRYGQGGLIRERFAPRLLEADPKTLLDEAGDNLDPDQIWATLMRTKSRAAMASARSRSAPSTWRCGTRWRRSPASRCSACSPSGTGARPIRACSSMPPAAIIIPARTCRCCAARCAAISIAATPSSR